MKIDLISFSSLFFFASLPSVPFRFIISFSLAAACISALNKFGNVWRSAAGRSAEEREKRRKRDWNSFFFLLSVPLFDARYRTRATEFHREPRVELRVFRQLLLLLSRHSSYRMEFKNPKHLRFQLSRNPSWRWKEKNLKSVFLQKTKPTYSPAEEICVRRRCQERIRASKYEKKKMSYIQLCKKYLPLLGFLLFIYNFCLHFFFIFGWSVLAWSIASWLQVVSPYSPVLTLRNCSCHDFSSSFIVEIHYWLIWFLWKFTSLRVEAIRCHCLTI